MSSQFNAVRSFVIRSIGVAALAAFASTAFTGDSGNFGPENSSANEQELLEIEQLKKRMGGSVLRGTVLDGNAEEADQIFNAELRSKLGLKDLKGPSGSVPATPTRMSSPELVKTMRAHGAILDRIANDIEAMRQYEKADQLRLTAHELRRVARSYDKPAGSDIK